MPLLEKGFNMFWRYIISNSILILLFLWYNGKLFKNKGHKTKDIFIIFFVIAIKSFINLHTSFQLNLVFSILAYLIISSSFFIGTLTKKFIFIGFYIVASFISEMNSFLILNGILPSYKIIFDSLVYNLLGSLLSTIFLFVIIYIVTKINDIKDIVDNKELWYFIMLPVISILIIYSIMRSNMLLLNPNLCILITFGIIIFNIIICAGFVEIIQSRNILIENEKLKSQKLHYELLEQKFDNSKRFIHDFKKHINLINSYIVNDEYSKLKLYLNEISKEIKRDENFVITGNQIIDLALNSSKDVLSQYNIDIKHDVKIKDIKTISLFDFNIVFSNILENAIESCRISKGTFIKIKLEATENLVILKIINPSTQAKKNLKTTKLDTEYHGYGIKNIRKIALKYNGTATFEYDSKNHFFISTVIFSIV